MSAQAGHIVLIDGYNAVKRQAAWQALPLAAARQRLIAALDALRWPIPVASIIVVFDGHERSSHQPTARRPVCVRFTAGSADAELQRAIRTAEDASRLLVISNDAEILRTAKSHRAQHRSVEWLMDRCGLAQTAASTGRGHASTTDKPPLPAATARRITEELRGRWLSDLTSRRTAG